MPRVRCAAVPRTLGNASYFALCLLLGGVLASGPPRARAEEPQIAWSAPAGCPSAEVVRARVASLLSRQRSETRLRATGEISRAAAEGYRLTLDVKTNGHVAARTLRASDCAALSEAGAWLIALAVDPALVDAQVDPPPAPEAKPKAEVTGEVAVDSAADRRPPAARALRAGLLGGIYGSGLPRPVGSLGGRVGFLVGGLYGELAAAHLFSRSEPLTNGGRVAFSAQFLRLRGCYEWGARVRIAPCAGLTGFRTVGDAQAIAEPGREQAFWLAMGAALQVAYAVRAPVELIIDAGVDVPISARPRFEIPGYGEVLTGNFVSGHTTFGLGVRYQ